MSWGASHLSYRATLPAKRAVAAQGLIGIFGYPYRLGDIMGYQQEVTWPTS